MVSAAARKGLLGLLLAGTVLFQLRKDVFPLRELPTPDGDTGQMAWNLWHVATSFLTGGTYLTDRVFFPEGANLATHTLVAGYLPVSLATRGAMALLPSTRAVTWPFVAYQASIVLAFVLLLGLTRLFLRRVGIPEAAALFASVAFAFAPFFRWHTVHLNHLAAFCFPLAAWAAVGAYRTPSRGRIVLAGLAFGISVYFTEFAAFLGIGALLWLLFLLGDAEGRGLVRDFLGRADPKDLALSAFVAVGVATPFLVLFARSNVLSPGIEEAGRYSANLLAFFVPEAGATPLYGGLFREVDEAMNGVGVRGFEAFAGFGFLAAGWAGRRRGGPAARAAFLASLVFFVLALGPTLKIYRGDTGVRLPFELLRHVPGLSQNRTPVRFEAAALFLWTIPAAWGAARWLEAARRRSAALSGALSAGLLLFAVAETSSPARIGRAELSLPLERLGALAPGPVLDVPLDDPGAAMACQTVHGRPIATAYLARFSAPQHRRLQELDAMLHGDGALLSDWLRDGKYGSVLVHGPIPTAVYSRLAAGPTPVVDLAGEGGRRRVALLGAAGGETLLPESWLPEERVDPREFVLPEPSPADRVELLADGNDPYRVELFAGADRVAVLDAPPVAGPGYRWRVLSLPPEVRGRSLTRVVVRAAGGDGVTAVRSVVLVR